MATAPLNNLGKIALISNFVLLFWPCIREIWVKPSKLLNIPELALSAITNAKVQFL
jgi:hypothetical protein